MTGDDQASEVYRDLRVLDEIQRDSEISQRTLAKRLGIALGLTNSVLRRLIRKGLVTTRALPANRLAYHLTPKGLANKMRLALDYAHYTTGFFCNVRMVINNRLRRLMRDRPIRTVAIVGTSELADAAYLTARELELEMVGVYDAGKAGSRWLGMSVQTPREDIEADVILIADPEALGEAGQALLDGRDRAVMISDFLAADFRSFADGMRHEQLGGA
ncbi:MAG: winged helix-turn-helix transcriptional regulator [Planctomycetes bacterium]|nr:winged helix-turn-helix transcriptional regulator [Planctomycetota bacterium]